MGQRIAGVAYVRVDGAQYPLKGNFTVSSGALERKGISGQDYVHGYSEMPRVPFIEGDVSTIPELSTEDIEEITDATVQADLANGKTYVLRNAWFVGPIEINTAEGTMKIKFEGVSCDEVGA